MITGKTERGFEFQIEEEALDDMELLDALVDIDNGRTDKISTVCVKLLGKEQRARLYDFLRGENGRVKASDASQAVYEILAACAPGKKS